MKILLVHNRYRSSISGEDRVVDQEGAMLESAGHSVARFERFSEDIARQSPVQKALVPGRVVWSARTRRELSAVLGESRPDVVHVHNTFPLVSPSVLYACRDARVPAVLTFHNYRPMCPTGTLYRDGAICHECLGRVPLPGVRHGCYRGSHLATVPLAVAGVVHRTPLRTLPSAYVFISAAQRDLFGPLRLPEKRMFVKHNLVPRPAEPPATEREHNVFFAGRLTGEKGLPLLMAAWERHERAAPQSLLRLVIAGSGPLEASLRDWVARRSTVDFVGLLDRAECARRVASARAVVVPSAWHEPFGLIACEAMAVASPVIGSDYGALPELVTDGVDGILFRPGDADGLAEVFSEVDRSPARFEELGRRARLTYEQKFDPQANINRLVEIYEFARAQPAWRHGDGSSPQ